ncbi:MAG: ABC transporter substrate-binding protein [Gemmataceae bacterium]|nr:ABC transporter substrate-binding protein [Gemmataceae bacterium]
MTTHTDRGAEPGRADTVNHTRVSRRAALSGLLGLAGAAALATACQQPTFPSRSAEAKPTVLLPVPPTSTPAATAKPSSQSIPLTPAPKQGGALSWALGADPGGLDPYTNPDPAAVAIWGDLVYQSLVMYDDGMKLAPGLGEAWVNTSPTTWTFKLRQGVTFHDGSTFEAADVRAWFEHLQSPATASPHRAAFRHIAGVEVRGRYEVAFTLTAPYAPFLASFAALHGSAIVPSRWLPAGGGTSKTPAAGSGPFAVAEYVAGSHAVYTRASAAWERGLPHLDAVTLSFIPDPEARIAALRSGQVHGASITPDLLPGLRSERTLTVLKAPGATQHLTIMNTRREPFDDARVRQALAVAVDRAAALSRVLDGEGQLTGPIPPGPGGWATPAEELPYRPDLPAARALLAEAELPDGFETTIRTTAASPVMLWTATLLAEQLRPLGITVKVEQLSASALASAFRTRDFDLITHTVGYEPDPDGYLSPYFQERGAQNAAGWRNAAFDEAIDAARAVLDPGQRRALYAQATGILLGEAPAIWWFTEHQLAAVQANPPTVRGFAPGYDWRLARLKAAWLDG